MNTFLGLGRRHVDMYYQKTSHAVFLRIKRIKHEVRSERLIVMDLCFCFENSNICGFNEIETGILDYFILYAYEVLRFVQLNPIKTDYQLNQGPEKVCVTKKSVLSPKKINKHCLVQIHGLH